MKNEIEFYSDSQFIYSKWEIGIGAHEVDVKIGSSTERQQSICANAFWCPWSFALATMISFLTLNILRFAFSFDSISQLLLEWVALGVFLFQFRKCRMCTLWTVAVHRCMPHSHTPFNYLYCFFSVCSHLFHFVFTLNVIYFAYALNFFCSSRWFSISLEWKLGHVRLKRARYNGCNELKIQENLNVKRRTDHLLNQPRNSRRYEKWKSTLNSILNGATSEAEERIREMSERRCWEKRKESAKQSQVEGSAKENNGAPERRTNRVSWTNESLATLVFVFFFPLKKQKWYVQSGVPYCENGAASTSWRAFCLCCENYATKQTQRSAETWFYCLFRFEYIKHMKMKMKMVDKCKRVREYTEPAYLWWIDFWWAAMVRQRKHSYDTSTSSLSQNPASKIIENTNECGRYATTANQN